MWYSEREEKAAGAGGASFEWFQVGESGWKLETKDSIVYSLSTVIPNDTWGNNTINVVQKMRMHGYPYQVRGKESGDDAVPGDVFIFDETNMLLKRLPGAKEYPDEDLPIADVYFPVRGFYIIVQQPIIISKNKISFFFHITIY